MFQLTRPAGLEYVAKYPMFLSTSRMALLIFVSSFSSAIGIFCIVGLILN